MKTALTILALSMAVLTSAQSLPELIEKYEQYCNETVKDTIIQTGTITEKMVKVPGTNYYAVQLDTIWNSPSCPEFKQVRGYAPWISQGSVTYTTLDVGVVHTTGAIRGTEWSKENTRPIQRDYVCEVKRREIEPFSEHFWNWIKDKK